MQRIKPVEGEIGPVHEIEGSRFRNQQIENIDVVKSAIRDVNKTGNASADIEQRVEFDSSFGFSKTCPWKQRQTQIDGCGIEGINGLAQIDANRFLSVQRASDANESLSKFAIEAPIA
jgi:hypothetical protein